MLLRENWRDDGKVKKRTFANLSDWPTAMVEGFQPGAEGGRRDRRGPLHHPPRAAARPCRRGARHAARDRPRPAAAAPATQRARARWRSRSIVSRRDRAGLQAGHRARADRRQPPARSLGRLLGLGEVDEDELYRALDWLIEQQTRIETALAKRHLTDGTLVLYDVSSSYMEGRCCALAQPGYSRDRPDRPQIVYGLLCAPDGSPVAVEVFEGNTSDPKTIREQIDKLKRRFKPSHVVLVGDRGMIT